MRHLRLRIFERRHLLRGFGECVALLGLALAARGQSAAQDEGYGACYVPSEVALAESGQSAAPSFISFEAPGAGKGASQGTVPYAINSAGVTTGNYVDSRGVYHGFVRATNGNITTFNAPGAGMGAGQGTVARSINTAGAITGYYSDSSGVYHGFVRAANGTIATFSVGALSTEALSINSAGVTTGYYADQGGVYHGFVRDPYGTIVAFDAPNADTSTAGRGTFPYAINDPCGTIAGFYIDIGGKRQGFVRYPDNNFGDLRHYTALSINSAPCYTITGYLDEVNVYHGFVRTAHGQFTYFDVPAAGTAANQGTQPGSINSSGTVTGDYIDSVSAYHGFVRAANGAVTTFDAPGAGMGVGQGTIPSAINSAGVITGYYLDSSNVYHGFVR